MFSSLRAESKHSISSTKLEELVGGLFESLEEERNSVKSIRARVSGILAIILGSSLILTGVWHIRSVSNITSIYTNAIAQCTKEQSDECSKEIIEQKWDHISKPINVIADTSKTIYAILGPLAAAAAGFYFSAQGSDKN